MIMNDQENVSNVFVYRWHLAIRVSHGPFRLFSRMRLKEVLMAIYRFRRRRRRLVYARYAHDPSRIRNRSFRRSTCPSLPLEFLDEAL